MATATTDINVTAPRQGAIARVFAAFLHRLENRGQYAARRRRIEALEAKTDAELAAMGLRRRDIVHHVFRDLYYI